MAQPITRGALLFALATGRGTVLLRGHAGHLPVCCLTRTEVGVHHPNGAVTMAPLTDILELDTGEVCP